MKVAILGCGPSGLLATHAAVLLGHEPTVYSIPIQSDTPGTMYLHRAIPELTADAPDDEVRYRKVGSRDAYAVKVYGDREAPCSWDQFKEGWSPAWSMRAAYEELWKRYNGLIEPRVIGVFEIAQIVQSFQRVISTIPARALCRKPYHRFHGTSIWVGQGAQPGVRPREIVYNGRIIDNWYRSSDIFGFQVTEFSKVIVGLYHGTKPIRTDCDCWDDRILKVGRFGTWSKGELIHHAFEKTYNYLGE